MLKRSLSRTYGSFSMDLLRLALVNRSWMVLDLHPPLIWSMRTHESHMPPPASQTCEKLSHRIEVFFPHCNDALSPEHLPGVFMLFRTKGWNKRILLFQLLKKLPSCIVMLWPCESRATEAARKTLRHVMLSFSCRATELQTKPDAWPPAAPRHEDRRDDGAVRKTLPLGSKRGAFRRSAPVAGRGGAVGGTLWRSWGRDSLD